MDRSRINDALITGHRDFVARMRAVPTDKLDRSNNGKWTPAQHLKHIQRAVGPVSMALLLPKWFLRWRFGKPNRAPRDYDGLVLRYKEKLAAGGRASGRFVPPPVPAHSVQRIIGSVERIMQSMTKRVGNWSEQELDTVLLPHPLLGKLTVREMLFFTVYHVQHHHALVDRDYPVGT